MQIIFDKTVAEELDGKYIVLPLETIEFNGNKVNAFCVVTPESLINELDKLELNKSLHQQFLQAIDADDTVMAQGLVKHLVGTFGGELDTFYQEVDKRIAETGSCRLVINAA